MSQICSRVNSLAEGATKHKSTKKPAKNFLPCTSGVVYNIPLSCGKCYVGQTGRWLNYRLGKHDYSLSATLGGHLATHCKDCTCTLLFRETSILGRHKDKLILEVPEAYHILSAGKECTSVESVVLTKERDFLTKKWRPRMNHVFQETWGKMTTRRPTTDQVFVFIFDNEDPASAKIDAKHPARWQHDGQNGSCLF